LAVLESLPKLLLGELAELKRFCALIEEERNVLTGAQADRLPDIAAAKASLAAQLSEFQIQRESLLAREGLPKGREGLEAWLERQPKSDVDTRRLWTELLALAAQARDGNETNGRLINLLLKQNQDALSVLLGGGSESIYGADGQSRTLASGKRSFGAV
jgi:flagellar biosynthesis/type III secretory pathway chaperone